MSIKVYKVLANTTIQGKFYAKGSEVSLASECNNVNLKLIEEKEEEKKKSSKK